MKKVILIMFLIVFFITGCTNSKSVVNFSTDTVDVKSVDKNIQSWITSNNKNNGMYICKITESGKHILYLYINNLNAEQGEFKSYDNISVQSEADNLLDIAVKIKKASTGTDKLFKITVKGDLPDYIKFNGEKIESKSILSIDK